MSNVITISNYYVLSNHKNHNKSSILIISNIHLYWWMSVIKS